MTFDIIEATEVPILNGTKHYALVFKEFTFDFELQLTNILIFLIREELINYLHIVILFCTLWTIF
jgi:hypothetical protein